MSELEPGSKNPLYREAPKGVPSELAANAERLLNLLAESNVPPSEWARIIDSARQAGVLGSPEIPDCLERMKALNSGSVDSGSGTGAE